MPSLFSRSHQAPKKDRAPAVLVTNANGPDRRILGLAKTWNGSSAVNSSPSVGEFGTVPQHYTPRHGTLPSSPEGPALSESSHSLHPNQSSFLPTHIPTTVASLVQDNASTAGADDVIKQYGFLAGVGRNVVLGLDEVARVIRHVGDELARRALDTPMLFSNQSLELNQIRIRMLIQSFLTTVRTPYRAPPKTAPDLFAQDVQFANDQELAWLLRWALARMTRIREPTREVCHGCIDWEMYEEWRGRERAGKYPFDAFANFAAILPADVYFYIVQPLFELLSKFAAHSHKSGLTPHAIASYFAPLLFDIPANAPCLTSHASFVRAASATEHMLLAYVRSTGRRDDLGLSDLPFRLQEWVKGYPSMVASDADLARGLPRRAARVVRCEVAARTVRAYARDLVINAESWADDIQTGWDAWDRVLLRTRRGEGSRPKFSTAWRRRMVVKETPPLPPSVNNAKPLAYGAPLRSLPKRQDEKDEGEVGRFGSLAGKEWSAFEEGGFDAPKSMSFARNQEPQVDIQSRLQFDLNESAKKSVAERRQTMDWSEFANGGFNRTDPALSASLNFSKPVQASITEWPKERDELRRRLQKTQKESTPFHHDTTPRTGPAAAFDGADPKGRVYVEEAFVDCWTDFMMGAGWTDREELTFKEASWALIEYKALPSHPDEDAPHPSTDPRVTDLYFLFEERVPMDYQLAVADPKRKNNLHKLFSKKKHKPDVRNMTQSDFDRMLTRNSQKKITMSRADQSVSSALWHAMTEPSKKPQPPLPTSPSLSSQRTARPMAIPKSPGSANGDDKLGNRPGLFKKSIRRVKSGEQSPKAERSERQGKKQREVSMEFEIQTASGVSSGNNSPHDAVHDSEKWMDILIANGARPMDTTLPPVPVHVPAPVQETAPIPLPKSPPIRTSPPPPRREIPGRSRRVSPPEEALTPTTTKFDKMQVALASLPALQPPLELDMNGYNDSELAYDVPRESLSVYDQSSVHSGSEATDTSVQPSDSISMRRRPDSPPLDSPTHAPEEILASPRASPDAYAGIVAPQPRIANDRDAIFSIVDKYSDNSRTAAPGDEGDAAYAGLARDSYFDERQSAYSDNRESIIERTYASERVNSAYSTDDFPPPPIFDLTPGREPSPARYKHGEPLQFVGEEEEEEEF